MSDALEKLRQAFDEAFARPVAGSRTPDVALVAIAMGEDRLALPLSELTGVYAMPALVPLPGAPGALLGVAGLRGQLVPVYGLAALLGSPAPPGPPAWIVVYGRREPVALAFHELVGHRDVPPSAVRPLASRPLAGTFVRAVVRAADGPPLALLDLAALDAVIRPSQEERPT
jgi:purine-binding chemotaxis protein CheW